MQKIIFAQILMFIKEAWAGYPINRIMPHTINKWKEDTLKFNSGGSVNRKLDVLSSMFTTFKKEWGYPVDNPVLGIRRPKRAEPRDRRLSDAELASCTDIPGFSEGNYLLRGIVFYLLFILYFKVNRSFKFYVKLTDGLDLFFSPS